MTVDLRYLLPTLRNMGASQMVKIAEKAGMMDDFYDNNYTVFCPPNDVLEAMQDEVEDEMEVSPREEVLSYLFLHSSTYLNGVLLCKNEILQ